jgi:hypothetical protein
LRPGTGAISFGSGAWTLGMKAFDFIFGDEAYAMDYPMDEKIYNQIIADIKEEKIIMRGVNDDEGNTYADSVQ